MATVAELTTRLAEIRTAISRALQGQSVSFGGRSWTSQDLVELRSMEAATEAALAAAQGGARSRLASVDKGYT